MMRHALLMQNVTARLPPRPALGPALFTVAATAATASALLDLQVPGEHRALVDLGPGWVDTVAGASLAMAGMAVLGRYPRQALGRLLSIFGAWWALDGLACSWLAYATTHDPALPGASVAFWIFQRLGAGLLLPLPLVLLLYPDGRLPSGRWRAVSLASLALTSLLPLALIAVPSDIAQTVTEAGRMPAPLRALELDPVDLPLPEGVWTAVLRAAQLSIPLSLPVPFIVVVRRYRAASGTTRTRMRWLLWAAVVDLLVMLTIGLLPGRLDSIGLSAAVVVTAGSVAVGIVRPGLADVDRLLGVTSVYGVLLMATLVLDLLVLGSLSGLLGPRLDEGERLAIAVFAVSAVYAPLRHRLWRLARRWVVGERDDPYSVVAGLAERLERADDSEVQLVALARTVAQAFRAPYVGVEVTQVSGERLLVEDGRRPAGTRSLPITYRGERIGRLLLPEHGGLGGRLTPADERLLADLVRQGAAAARAAHLAGELQRSRERIVSAVEDERRRLRRELHDGLGPALAAVASRIDTARIIAPRSLEDADRTLGLAREEIAGMLTEVRRLVHGLRPPALDDIGLVGAIRRQADRLRAPGMAVSVDGRGDLTGLPAAVEVAAYRIASEALNNVVRHAKATECAVSLALDDRGECLVVEVTDNGVGIAAEAVAGVGMVSLRERAAELGGRCTVTSAEPNGTRVCARLPVSPDGRTPALTAAGEGEQ